MNEITAVIEGTNLIVAQEFKNIMITDDIFSKLDFENTSFYKCKFMNCQFENTYFYKCQFINCDISNCFFTKTFFKECYIEECKAIGTEFPEAIIRNCHIKNSIFRYANLGLSKIDDTKIEASDFTEASMNEIVFKKIKLDTVILINVDFFKTKLKSIDLSSCDIEGILISDTFNELKGAKINAEQAANLISLLGIQVI